MISTLTIQNYALIDELEMKPSDKLNIITGETGAGKSIMLGAVGLLIGNRSDSKVLLHEDRKCIVEGSFDIRGYQLEELFAEQEIDYDEDCIIRREISTAGKSRAFVNDTPVTLPFLKALGQRLLDVHSQHESLNLGDKIYQLNVLDAFAAHQTYIDDYKKNYLAFIEHKKAYERLVDMASQSAEDEDYKQYLLNELREANLDGLDQSGSEQALEVLENAEDIKIKLSESHQLLNGEEISVLQSLAEVRHLLSTISTFSDDLKSISDRLESQRLEMDDLSNEIQVQLDKTEFDPEQASRLKDQLDLLYRLQKKHTLQNVDQLVELRDELEANLTLTSNLDKEIEEAKKVMEVAEKDMLETGEILRESRQLSALDLAAEIEKIIHKIGIENGHIELKVHESEPTIRGLDSVEMHFSANKGIPVQELSEVASGGEFSRLIFAIKHLIAGKTAMPTVIFDEIDTGVSGEVALQMVQMMKEMANNHQVIAISHLPQFAAGGDAHYFVYKDNNSDRSVSKIRKLESQDRITEIAKMIGGDDPTNSAYTSAKELLGIS
ncbi:MAG: DNA repair protein RecN [Cytophagales bacterium]|nr:DNA repair protein RecN [Cytophagales bacterium]